MDDPLQEKLTKIELKLICEKGKKKKRQTSNLTFEKYHLHLIERGLRDFWLYYTDRTIFQNKREIHDLLYRSEKMYSQLQFTSNKIKTRFTFLIHRMHELIQQRNHKSNTTMKRNIRDFHSNSKLKLPKVIDLLRERNLDLTTLPDEFLPKLSIELGDFKIKIKDNTLYYEELSEDKTIKTITNVNDKNDTFTYLDTEWDYYTW